MTTDEATPQTNPTAERPFPFRLAHLLIVLTGIAAGLALLVPLVRNARDKALRASCGNNLRQLAIALHNYHDIYNRFPPAYHIDAAGKPVHSWRVMIWNMLEAQPYFSQYSFAEPWNGPKNSTLSSHMSSVYRCPADSTSPKAATNYVAVVGKNSMWPGADTLNKADVSDGLTTTLMIVEISHSDIHWMEPRDLPVEELEQWLDPEHRPQLLGNHIEGGMVAYADGHVEMLSRDVTIERLKALASRAGGD